VVTNIGHITTLPLLYIRVVTDLLKVVRYKCLLLIATDDKFFAPGLDQNINVLFVNLMRIRPI